MLTVRTCYNSFMKMLTAICFFGGDNPEEYETSSSDTNIEEFVDVELIDEVGFVDEVEAVPRKQKFFNRFKLRKL